MGDTKIIAVAGATGAQGGGLVRAILKDSQGGFSARAITRNANSQKAKDLAELGAEVVEADLDDLESLKRAFRGAYGCYCVTFFWEHMSPETEYKQAGNMAEAAKQEKIPHVIWSTLEDTRKWIPLDDDRMPTLLEKYKVPHFDAKGVANELFAAAGIPTTYLLTSFYWDNFIHFGMGPKKGADGELVLTLPMGDRKLPGIAADDIGQCAFGIFKRGDEFIGKTVGIAGGKLTGDEMAEKFTHALGRKVRYHAISPKVYRSFGFPGADDLGNMFQFKHDFADDFCAARDLELSQSLNPELQTLEEWLKKNKNRIPLE